MTSNYATFKRWRQNHRDEYQAADRLYKRLRRSKPFKALWPEVVWAYGGACLACGSKDRIGADHVMPLSRGGENCLSNLQPLCTACNTRKRDRIIDCRQDKGARIVRLMVASGFQPVVPAWPVTGNEPWPYKGEAAAKAKPKVYRVRLSKSKKHAPPRVTREQEMRWHAWKLMVKYGWVPAPGKAVAAPHDSAA